MKKGIFMLLSIVIMFSGCSGNKVKTVTDKEITLSMEVGERVGTYTGEMLNGIPNGVGKFETVNPEGVKWYYEGDFVDGTFTGQGVTVWETGKILRGTYENFVWKPNSAQIFESLESIDEVGMSDAAKKFIENNNGIFPASVYFEIQDFVDKDISYKMITKEPNKYGDKIVLFENLYINQIRVFPVGKTQDGYTYMTAYDEDYNVFELYYVGSLPDILDGDTVSKVYGIPLAVGGYETVAGGFANTIEVAVSFVE